jgi:hypothetical protein
MIKLLTAPTIVVILVAMATAGIVKPKIFSTVGAAAALPTDTISANELQRQVDVRGVQDGAIRLSAAQLGLLLEGLDWSRVRPRPVIAPVLAG